MTPEGERALELPGDDGLCGVRADVFLVGLRYPHHARHSGYDGFARHVGIRVKAPVPSRRSSGAVGRAVDRALARAVGQPKYSVALLLAEIAAAAHMVRRSGCVYHFFYGERDLLMLRRLSGVRGNRIVASFHGPLAVPPGRVGWVSRSLDALVLVSEYQRRYFQELVPQERTFVVRHGTDTEFFRPASELSREPVCITVGSHQRDFSTLARAMEHVWRARPTTRFVFVGLEGPGDLARLLDDPRVQVLSTISDEDLRAAYQGARLAVLSFQNATASNALLEAMACGLPVVATDVGGVAEYVAGGSAGLCAPGDGRALAEGMLRILEDSAYAQKVAEASRAAAVARDYRIVAKELREVYDRVLLDPPVRASCDYEKGSLRQ